MPTGSCEVPSFFCADVGDSSSCVGRRTSGDELDAKERNS